MESFEALVAAASSRCKAWARVAIAEVLEAVSSGILQGRLDGHHCCPLLSSSDDNDIEMSKSQLHVFLHARIAARAEQFVELSNVGDICG